jgi:two-component system sensor histidine kinase BaeS
MKLRLRLRLAAAAIAVAAVTIAALLSIDLSDRQAEGSARLIANLGRVFADPDEQARCAADPAAWGPLHASDPPVLEPVPAPPGAHGDHRPPAPPPPRLDPQLLPIELFVLDGELRPARPDGPRIDQEIGPELLRDLASSGAIALPTRWGSSAVAAVVATPWRTGPCRYLYARGHARLGTRRIRPRWLLPLGAALFAVVITMSPVVRRIRRLAGAVTASAATGFVAEIPVEGDDEVAELARAFAAASRTVRAQLSATEQREAILRDFLASTTHDVMIPLTVLQAHLAAMQEDERTRAPRRGAVLTSAMDEAHYLGALLQNLAAVAKLDSGAWQPVIGRVDLNALVHRVVSRHQVIARRLEITVEFAVPEDPVAVAGDLTLLEQAVSNVVYNAIRHNRAGGHVAVILEAAAGDRFSLRVIDDGPGVPAAELARLVERGFRGNAARTRSPDGLGLGLNITLRVAELHRLDLRFGGSQYGGVQVDLEGPRLVRSPGEQGRPGE